MLKRMIRNVVDNATRYATEELRFDSHYDGDEAVVIVAMTATASTSARVTDSSSASFVRTRRAPVTPVYRFGTRDRREIVERHGGSARFAATDVGTRIELRVRRHRRKSSEVTALGVSARYEHC